MPNYILGVAAHYHDSSACLLKDGIVVAAAQEERFTRVKHDEAFPIEAIKYCLSEGQIRIEDIDQVVYYEKPIIKFERLLKTYIHTWPKGFRSFQKAMKTWLGQKLWIESEIRSELGKLLTTDKKKPKFERAIYFVSHHLSHAASTYYSSDFNTATIVTADGVGEWATTTIAVGEKQHLSLQKEIHFPHSLGLLYSAFTYYLGFKVNSAEYKVMGLAPYGKPIYKDKVYEILTTFDDGSFALNQKFFTYEYALRMVGRKFANHFGEPIRKGEESPLTQFHKDMAASLQSVTEELMLKLVKHAYKCYPNKNLCLAGGVALNCVANGRIVREGPFENVYVFPASGDAGGSVGAAAYFYYQILGNEKKRVIDMPYLGPSFSDIEIKSLLEEFRVEYTKVSEDKRAETIAQFIAKDKVVGHFSGAMEFGPRALGNRSILADPRNKENWQRVNLKIKFRESFRPFAPTVMSDKSDEYFMLNGIESPYMLLTTQTKHEAIPAVTHVDGSARVQTVSREQNKDYYNIIASFEEIAGCGAVINTSFNVRGEPIVCNPFDALKGFIRTDMDILVMGNFIIEANKVNKADLKSKIVLEDFVAD